MKKLACAKLSTPIMPKISVRPLDNMNNSIPYRTPLKSEKMTISKEPDSPLLCLVVMFSGTQSNPGPAGFAGFAVDQEVGLEACRAGRDRYIVIRELYYLGGRVILQVVGKVISSRATQPSVLYAIL